MHYRGLLRVAQRQGVTRLHAVREPAAASIEPQAAQDALLDLAVAKYATMPASRLGYLLSGLSLGGTPQWRSERAAMLQRAK